MAYINGIKILFSAKFITGSGGIMPNGTLEITENGTYDVTDKASVEVNVEGNGVSPVGIRDIKSNGTYDVTQFAKANVQVQMPALEGTAIPIGEFVDKIYFNTSLSREETEAYLSQLTYRGEDVFGFPLAIPFLAIESTNANTGFNTLRALVISDMSEVSESGNDFYEIEIMRGELENPENISTVKIFSSGARDGWESPRGNGWYDLDYSIDRVFMSLTSVSEFNGIPIGAENEKIQNVISATPFAKKDETVEEWDSSDFTKGTIGE